MAACNSKAGIEWRHLLSSVNLESFESQTELAVQSWLIRALTNRSYLSTCYSSIMANITSSNEDKPREESKADRSGDSLAKNKCESIQHLLAENVSALKQLVLTPPRVKVTFHQDSATDGKRPRCIFETPSPSGSNMEPASKTTRALGSPPQLKRTVFKESPKGPNLLEIADRFPTLVESGEEHREDYHRDEDLAFARRLKMKPINRRSELPCLIP